MFHLRTRSFVRDLLIVAFIQCVALFLMWKLETNFLISAILVFGIPTCYLLWRSQKQAVKIIFAASVIGVLGGFVFAFAPELNGAWQYGEGIIFPRILGVVPVDELIWSFVCCAFIIAFYEHFIDRSRKRQPMSAASLMLVLLLSGLSVINALLFYFVPELLNVPYAYLTVASVVTVVFLAASLLRPSLVFHALPMAIYFTVVNLVYEIVSLHNDHWYFPGEYLGWVSVGGISLPLEEFVFFILLFSVVIAVFYELFFDNQRS